MLTTAELFLIESIKSGDKKAFEFLFSKYYSNMWKYATSLVRNDAAGEDLVMDVFIRLWETAPGIDFRTSLAGYLCQCVHNHCINYLTRHKKRFPGLSQETLKILERTIPANGADNPDDKLCFAELSNKIEAAIDKLPEECRKIFNMSRFEEYSHEEIAEKLGISQNTVKVQVYRALQKLREIIRDYG